ncbi:MAG: isoaspartyl peptidase/L-asparaginase [Actinomycetota bacterium]|nr:isoaspartyl peptidase/L-asparaginase [Actinomycetota bacterium]
MSPTAPVLLIHGGEGDATVELREHEAAFREALLGALEAGRRALEAGGGAIDVAQAAVAEMESCELFNAGRGSALCSDGSVQMSAALMRGSDRAAGAVAGLSRTEHPILAARYVLESEQVLFAGEWADRHAAALGAAQRDNAFFVTEHQRARLLAVAGAEGRRTGAEVRGAVDEVRGTVDEVRGTVGDVRGTVGAVCLDSRGVLAAATSTGGRSGQPPGRVGDSPVIGAGTWADQHVAVSCTGAGEAFIRAGAAHQIAMLLKSGLTVAQAAERSLADVAKLSRHGGLIAVDSTGATATPLLSEVMPGGVWRAGVEPMAWVTDPPRRFGTPR